MAAASISRADLEARIRLALKRNPVAALLGPRQCGKTTLARRIAAERGAEFIDVESPAGRRRLDQARGQSSLLTLPDTSGGFGGWFWSRPQQV